MKIFSRPTIMYKALTVFLICAMMPLGVEFAKNTTQLENEDIFRLHIIANSNDYVDQMVKYIVRDAVLSFEKDLCLDPVHPDFTQILHKLYTKSVDFRIIPCYN